MVIQHNMLAFNSNRMFGITTAQQKKNTERLSSGYQINRAADDAAGLAISEKMRRQIRGLGQASKNCQDGISLVQVADGAMAEIDDMLHRGSELAIKAANGTLTAEDRTYIQSEIDGLVNEIEDISLRTTFNDMLVLRGAGASVTVSAGGAAVLGGLPSWIGLGAAGSSGSLTDTVTLADGDHSATILDFSSFTGTDEQIEELTQPNSGFYSTCCTCTRHYSINFTNDPAGTVDSHISGNASNGGVHEIYKVGIGGLTTGAEIAAAVARVVPTHFTQFIDNGDGTLTVYDNRDIANNPTAVPSGGMGILGPGVAYSADDAATDSPVDIIIQAGSEAGQSIRIQLPAVSKNRLGIQHVDVTTQGGASNAITSFKDALSFVAGERSRMGAYQNRLEHTIKNLDNIVENTTSAESRIRDTDMAETMVRYANDNILAQAGASVLAQSNQASSSVMTLLG